MWFLCDMFSMIAFRGIALAGCFSTKLHAENRTSTLHKCFYEAQTPTIANILLTAAFCFSLFWISTNDINPTNQYSLFELGCSHKYYAIIYTPIKLYKPSSTTLFKYKWCLKSIANNFINNFY